MQRAHRTVCDARKVGIQRVARGSCPVAVASTGTLGTIRPAAAGSKKIDLTNLPKLG